MAYLLQAVKWGLVIGAAALVLALLRPRLDRRYRARWRYWLWMVLAALLLLAPLPWPSLLPEAAEEAMAPAVVLEVPRTLGPTISTEDAAPVDTGGAALPAPAPTVEAAEPVEPETALQEADRSLPAIPWDRALPGLWLAVAAGLLGWHLTGSLRFVRRARRWSRAPGEATLALCREIEAELGMKKPTPVWVCPLAASPMAAGLLRPRLLLPAEDYGERELGFILRHELTHIRRRDLWYKFLLLTAACLHWFNPLVWLLRRQGETDLELTCDDAVAEGLSGGDRRAYGEALLADLGRRRGLASPLSTRFRGGKAALRARLRNLLSAPRRWGGPALAAALALVLIAACSFGIRQAGPVELDQEALADWEARLNTEAWNAALLRMYTDPAEPTVSDGYLAENYPLYPREEGGAIPVTNEDFSDAARWAVNETGAVPTDIPLVPVMVHSGTEDGDTVTLEVSLAWANASGFTGGTLTIVDGEAVRFTTPLYEAAETAAREYLRQTAADLEAEGTAVADSRITALVRAVEYDFDDTSYSAWYLRYELQSGSTGVWISESASLGLPVLLLREDPDGTVTLLETCFAGLLEPAGLSYSRTGEDIDGYTWEEYLYCKHHLGMALGTRVEGWPDAAAAFFLDLQAGRQSWTQDMTETALPDGGLLLEDLNFDGYLDIALQGWTAVGNRPYYLWFCDLDSGMPAGLFTYGGCVNGPLTVDRENQRVVAETVDQAGALRYRHIYRPDGLGGLYLARQETWTLEGEDYVLTAAEDFRQEGASSRPLTEGELQALAAWFNLWSDYPENNGLLRFPYDTPEDAGDYLGLLFYDMGLSDWDYLEAAEREALAEAGLPEWMDLFKLPREEVNAYLREKFGIDEERADAILDSAADPPGPVYLEEYDAWYSVHTDTWYQRYIFQSGWELPDGSWVVEYINDFMASGPPDGEGAHSYWSDAPMRLVVSPGEDGWIVGSHQPAG